MTQPPNEPAPSVTAPAVIVIPQTANTNPSQSVTATINLDTSKLVGKVLAAAPTQMRRPWRTTVRTVIQTAVAVAAGAPLLYQSATHHSTAEASGSVAVVLGVAAAVTRVMATPTVNGWLTKLGLGAEPKA